MSFLSKVPTITEQCSLKTQWYNNLVSSNGKTDNSFIAFKKKIDKYYNSSIEAGIQTSLLRTGAILFKECIKRKLKILQTKTKNESDVNDIVERIKWFSSSECTKAFMKQMNMGYTYSSFLDDIFDSHGNGVKWRDILEGNGELNADGNNPKVVIASNQCKVVIGDYEENDKCYICGKKFKTRSNPECEHLLSIGSAVSHMWLVKDTKTYDEEDIEFQNFIKNEYRWAHKCCNRVKSHRDMIKLINTGYYEVDVKSIVELLIDISKNVSYDCTEIKKVNDDNNKIRIIGLFQTIVNIINKNVEAVGDEYYPIYLRYRFLSAITDDNFDSIIRYGQLGGGNTPFVGVNPTPEDALTNIFTSKEIDAEIDEDINAVINEFDTKETIDPDYFEPQYEKITHTIFDDSGGPITEIIFFPYKRFHWIASEVKRTGAIMPEFQKHSYFSDDMKTLWSIPTGINNPYGTFDELPIEDTNVRNNKRQKLGGKRTLKKKRNMKRRQSIKKKRNARINN